MKGYKNSNTSTLLVLVFLVLTLMGCKEEFVCATADCLDEISLGNDESTIIEEDNVFTDDEGQTYYCGYSCGTPSGDYVAPSNDLLLENLVIASFLPPSFDLSEFLPPVKSQGQQPSCVSWAVTYYLKSLQEKIQFSHDFDPTTIMSPAYTYNQLCKGSCTGTSIGATLDILKEKGALSLNEFPYEASECHVLPNETQDQLAERAKIGDYKALSGDNMVDEMKTLITQQTPIVIAAVLDQEFGKKDLLDLTAYREHDVTYEGASCHAMLVVGYSDTNNAFKVVNSWGEDWGDEGFVWIDYKAFENVSKPGEGFRVITNAYIAIDAI